MVFPTPTWSFPVNNDHLDSKIPSFMDTHRIQDLALPSSRLLVSTLDSACMCLEPILSCFPYYEGARAPSNNLSYSYYSLYLCILIIYTY